MVRRAVADGRAVGETIVGARKLPIARGALATTAIVVISVPMVILFQRFLLLLYLARFSVALAIASTTIGITIAGTAGTHFCDRWILFIVGLESNRYWLDQVRGLPLFFLWNRDPLRDPTISSGVGVCSLGQKIEILKHL